MTFYQNNWPAYFCSTDSKRFPFFNFFNFSIHQIQEVVSNQTMSDSEDWSGPLDEIAFWQTRSMYTFQSAYKLQLY